MEIRLQTPLEIPVDKFMFGFKKEDINGFMARKLVRKKYQELGYTVLDGDRFEKNMLVAFVRGSLYLDNYIKVKVGEYKANQDAELYRQEIVKLFGAEAVKKLLFLCRVCSYMGDPSFPDFIVFNDREIGMRYAYTGDELTAERVVFILLAKAVFGFGNIKLGALDFIDNKFPDFIRADIGKYFTEALGNLFKRVNMENCFGETGVDFTEVKKWVGKGVFGTGEFLDLYNKFAGKVSAESKLKGLLEKMEAAGVDISGQEKPDKLKAIVKLLGVNMMEANDVLILHEMVKGRL